MIESFADSRTQKVFEEGTGKGLPAEIIRRAVRKLNTINAAKKIQDCNVPPGNKLKKLAGDRADEHAIRINDQWRIAFRWEGGNAHNVKIEDYH